MPVAFCTLSRVWCSILLETGAFSQDLALPIKQNSRLQIGSKYLLIQQHVQTQDMWKAPASRPPISTQYVDWPDNNGFVDCHARNQSPKSHRTTCSKDMFACKSRNSTSSRAA